MENSSMKKNVQSFGFTSFAKWAVFAVGGYLLWKNRFKVQELLEEQGVKTPWMNGNVSDAVQSGAAKVSGATKRAIDPAVSSNL